MLHSSIRVIRGSFPFLCSCAAWLRVTQFLRSRFPPSLAQVRLLAPHAGGRAQRRPGLVARIRVAKDQWQHSQSGVALKLCPRREGYAEPCGGRTGPGNQRNRNVPLSSTSHHSFPRFNSAVRILQASAGIQKAAFFI
jgi:hypothetical protein